jgi:hypothetical protein
MIRVQGSNFKSTRLVKANTMLKAGSDVVCLCNVSAARINADVDFKEVKKYCYDERKEILEASIFQNREGAKVRLAADCIRTTEQLRNRICVW